MLVVLNKLPWWGFSLSTLGFIQYYIVTPVSGYGLESGTTSELKLYTKFHSFKRNYSMSLGV